MASRGARVASDADAHFIILDEGVDLRVGGVLGRAADRDRPPRGERRHLRAIIYVASMAWSPAA